MYSLTTKYLKEKHLYNLILLFFIVSLFLNSSFRPVFEMIFYIFFGYYFINERKILTKYFYWIMLFVMIAGLSIFWTSDFSQSLLEFRIMVQVSLIGNLLIGYIDTQEKVVDIFKMFVLSGLILITYLLIKLPLPLLISTRLGGVNRVGINPNTIGLNLTFSSIISLYFARKNKINYLFYMIFFLFIVLSGSRKALLFIAGATVIFILLKSKSMTDLIKKISILAIIMFVFVYLLMTVPVLYETAGHRIEALVLSVLGMGTGDGSTQIRSQMIDTGIKLIEQKVLFGYGIRAYGTVTGLGTYAHNNYVELMVGVGIIGTLFYYSMYVYLLKNLYQNKNLRLIQPLASLMILFPILEIGLVNYNDLTWHVIIAVIFSAINLIKTKNINEDTIRLI